MIDANDINCPCFSCDGDRELLIEELNKGTFQIEFEYISDEGYGHHQYEAVYYSTYDGRYFHAECGGCSCGGSSSWSEHSSLESAMHQVPEYLRNK